MPSIQIRKEAYDSMRYKKCMEYNHTVKRCTSAMMRCQKCSETGHSVEERSNAYCFHCGEAHYGGDKKCKVQKQQEEVLAMQKKMHV